MDFGSFLVEGHRRHGEDPEGVFESLPEGLKLSREPVHLTLLADLAQHVAGEHLGQWQRGAALLREIAAHELCKPDGEEARSLQRSIAWLHYCAGDREAAEAALSAGRTVGTHEDSDRICMLSSAASALVGRGGEQTAVEGVEAFVEALALASYDPPSTDPAARALAFTGNVVAWHLTDKQVRSAQETEVMTRAAATARKYWERVGTWLNVKIAEITVSRAQLAAGQALAAATHAQAALEICADNDAESHDRFGPYLELARARHALGDAEAASQALARGEELLGSMGPDRRPGSEKQLTSCRKELGLES